MGDPLKNSYGPEIPRRIARMIRAVYPRFRSEAFLAEALEGYEALALMARGRQIAQALRVHLPEDYPRAVRILLDSLEAKLPDPPPANALASFLYLPHTVFVAQYGLEEFGLSMQAQYVLTQRFSAEFSIRPFIERYPAQTLARLKVWARDPNVHVRRLVSEGTRPRLPWAPRLRALQADPRSALALLELLKDDPELYVRRSVANHLNDIGKDHPALLLETVRRWSRGATPERRWVIRHALRSAVKRGEAGALAVLGFGRRAEVIVREGRVAPRRVAVGRSVVVSARIANRARRRQRVLADLCVFFLKANGGTRAKVFKLKLLVLEPRETVTVRKTVSLAELTTRKPYPGKHRVALLLNGRSHPLAEFTVTVR